MENTVTDHRDRSTQRVPADAIYQWTCEARTFWIAPALGQPDHVTLGSGQTTHLICSSAEAAAAHVAARDIGDPTWDESDIPAPDTLADWLQRRTEVGE